MRIWKVSHGPGVFTQEKRQDYLDRGVISVHENTKKGAGEDFMKEMQVGDYFYLCFGNEVKLFGRITSAANGQGFAERSYDLIKHSLNSQKYTGEQKGWAPNYNSTLKLVPQQELGLFEKLILIPYFDLRLSGLDDDQSKHGELLENKTEAGYVFPLNQILYGPPGTGKTYSTVQYAMSIIDGKDYSDIEGDQYKELKARFDQYHGEGQIRFVTFHQSFGYEEFVEGIRPSVVSGQLTYDERPGVLKLIASDATDNFKKAEESKRFVLIIDEINRGNISKIFGELITLVEEDKRLGRENSVKVTLPYSQDLFSLPPNLYLLGTMNTADRSIALLDTALRRRFNFKEMPPRYDKLEEDMDGINLRLLLERLNERIEALYDRDHLIGHAYFMNIKSFNDLVETFRWKIIPLLQEYFYEDWSKIQAIFKDNDVDNSIKIIVDEKLPAVSGDEGTGYYNDEPKLRYFVSQNISPASITKIYT